MRSQHEVGATYRLKRRVAVALPFAATAVLALLVPSVDPGPTISLVTDIVQRGDRLPSSSKRKRSWKVTCMP
jgi:hypothetical protein